MEELVKTKKNYDLTIWVGLALMISFFIYVFFYTIADSIRGLNRIVEPFELSPPIRAWYMLPRDGIEPWVLYLLTTSIVFISIYFSEFKDKFKQANRYIYNLTKFVFSPVLLITLILRPPPVINILSDSVKLIYLLALVTLIWLLFLALHKYRSNLFLIAFSILIFPICFVAIGPLSAFDYNFILDPALRILHGFRLDQIYFQYDLLLPLFAIPFLIFNNEPNLIQFLFQFSYYLFFISILILSNSIFYNKSLSVSLIFTIVVVRFFAIQYEPTFAFQLTPLRLDLWVVALMLFWRYGMRHWSVGLFLGILAVLHRNLGVIYIAAYFACLFVNYLRLLFDNDYYEENKFELIIQEAIRYLKSCALPVCICVLFFVGSMIIFNDLGISHAARLYGSFGFGFDAINRSSYYWNTPVLISFTTILLFKLRKEISESYFSTVTFLIFVVIGNSLYFFGRSHETNILAISGSIVFLLFITIDLLTKYLNVDFSLRDLLKIQNVKCLFSYRVGISCLPLFIVLCSCFYYSKNIVDRLKVQYVNVSTKNFYQIIPNKVDLSSVKKATKGSNKVYGMLFSDEFNFYRAGGYVPIAYWFPYASWVFKKEQVQYLQKLLDSDYYLVVNLNEPNYADGQKEILDSLIFSRSVDTPPFVVIHK